MSPTSCKHYNGDTHNTHCKAGVCYKDVTTGNKSEPGSAFRKPCVDWDAWNKAKRESFSPGQKKEWDRRDKCDKFEFPTKTELEKENAEFREHVASIMVVTKLVSGLKKKHSKSWRGIEKCPKCGGKLFVEIRCFFSEYQGTNQKHSTVKCETPGCCAWIE